MKKIAALAGLAMFVALVACTIGGVKISFGELFAMLVGRDVDPTHASVFFSIRLPRIALGVVVGSTLGVSGTSMQAIFRNPLVDPGLLGISSGAAVGAVLAIVLGARPWVLPVSAFAGGIAALVIVTRVAKLGGRSNVTTLLLAGIAVNALASACIGILMFVADDAKLRTITFWSLGSLSGATTTTAALTLAFTVVPVVMLARLGRPLDALLLGEAESGHLGFDGARTRRLVLGLVALSVAASVAVSGVVAFVGLVVPHVLRLAFGAAHRVLLPASALAGAALLVVADTIARTAVSPAELPLGTVTAMLGAPLFLFLLVRETRLT